MVLLLELGLEPVSAVAQGSAYLLTQRSWMSRIGTGLRKCSFSRPRRRVTTRSRLLEDLQVLHHAEARHRQPPFERRQRLTVLLEQQVEQAAARRVRQRLEHLVHAGSICDLLVTCQRTPAALPSAPGRADAAAETPGEVQPSRDEPRRRAARASSAGVRGRVARGAPDGAHLPDARQPLQKRRRLRHRPDLRG